MRLSPDAISAVKAKKARFRAAAKRRANEAALRKQTLEPPSGPKYPVKVILNYSHKPTQA